MSSQKQWHRARAGVMDTVRQLRREADFWHERVTWLERRPPWWKFWAVRKWKGEEPR